MKIKGLVILVCFCFSVSSVFAQNWFAGGNFAFNFSSSESTVSDVTVNNNVRSIDISPTLGYRINKIDFGIYPTFTLSNAESTSSGNTMNSNSFGLGAGVFSRYNFVSFGNFSILGKLSADYLFLSSETSSSSSNQKAEAATHSLNFILKPIFEYKLLERISLFTDFGIGGLRCSFNQSSANHASGNSSSSKGTSFSLNIPSDIEITDFTIGFYIYF